MTTLLNYLLNEDVAHNDRALNYGDGCFTTIRCYKGQAELSKHHAARLCDDTKRLCIFDNADELEAKDFEVLVHHAAKINAEKAGNDWYVTKILISRGKGNRGYSPDEHSLPVIIISFHPMSSSQLHHANVGVSDVSLSDQPLLAGIKHLNRLEQVLAKLHLKKQSGLDDVLMLDNQGHVIELSAANLFFKVGEVWYSPELGKSGVSGVMRSYIVAYFDEQNIDYKIGSYHVSFFAKASSAFSCNALSHLRVIQSFHYLQDIIEFDTAEPKKLSKVIDKCISFQLDERSKENI